MADSYTIVAQKSYVRSENNWKKIVSISSCAWIIIWWTVTKNVTIGEQNGYLNPMQVGEKIHPKANYTPIQVGEKIRPKANYTRLGRQQEERQRTLKLACRRLKNGVYNHTNYYMAKRGAVFLTDHYHRTMLCILKKVSSGSWIFFYESVIIRERKERNNWLDNYPGQLSQMHKRWGRLNNSAFNLVKIKNTEGIDISESNYFKFIMVRHPLDRLASAYLDKAAGHNNTMDFEEFLRGAALFVDTNHHWRPFVKSCLPCSKIQFDYIAHLETLHDDLKVILTALNLTDMIDDFPHVVHSNTGPPKSNYKDMYANISHYILHDVFAKYQLDADMFGYSFDGYGNGM